MQFLLQRCVLKLATGNGVWARCEKWMRIAADCQDEMKRWTARGCSLEWTMSWSVARVAHPHGTTWNAIVFFNCKAAKHVTLLPDNLNDCAMVLVSRPAPWMGRWHVCRSKAKSNRTTSRHIFQSKIRSHSAESNFECREGYVTGPWSGNDGILLGLVSGPFRA